MALNASDVNAGDTILATDHNELIDDIEQHVHQGTDTTALTLMPGQASARAYLAADQENLTSGAWTKLGLDTESYDVNGDFDHSGNERFDCPATGRYLVCISVQFKNSVNDKLHQIGIYVDGALVSGTGRVSGSVGGTAPRISHSDILQISSGSFIELYAYQLSGVNTVDIESSDLVTFMAVRLLG